MLYIRTFVTMLIGIYSSRVLLRELGEKDFGIYNLIGSVVVLFSFLNAAMTVSTQRFLNFEMGRHNFERLNKVFCMAINIQALTAIVFGIISEVAGLFLLYNYLEIPIERMDAAFWVLQFSVLTAIFTILSTPYNALVIANEDMKSYAYIEILGAVLKLIVVLSLSYYLYDKLIIYASGIMLIQILLRFFYYGVCRYKFKEYHFFIFWEKKLFKEMLSFSSWTALSGISYTAKYQSISIFYNVFYGILVNAALGIALQVHNAINSLISSFTMSFNPQVVKNYAAGNFAKVRALHFSAPKITFFLTSIFSLPIIINTHYILALWLKEVPAFTTDLVRLALSDILIIALMPTANTVIRSSGHIKRYEIMTCIIVFSFIFLSYICGGLNIYIPYLMLILSTLTANLYSAYKSCKEIQVSYGHFLASVHGRMIFGFIVALGIAHLVQIENLNIWCLIVNTLIAISSVVSIEFYFGLTKNEKWFLVNYLKQKLPFLQK